MAKPGPRAKGELGTDERARFLALLRKGYGINLALRELKVHKRRYYLTLRVVKGFRRETRAAIACAHECLIKLRFDAAKNGDAKAQEFLIGRADRGRQFEREMKQRRAEFAAKNPPTKKDADDSPRRIIIPDEDVRHSPRTD